MAALFGVFALVSLLALGAWLRSRSQHRALVKKFAPPENSQGWEGGGQEGKGEEEGLAGGRGFTITLSPLHSASKTSMGVEYDDDSGLPSFGPSGRQAGRVMMQPSRSGGHGKAAAAPPVVNPLNALGMYQKPLSQGWKGVKSRAAGDVTQSRQDDIDSVDL